MPAADVTGTGGVTLGYYADDMVHTETQGSHTKTWTLDPAGRLYQAADSVTGHTKTNYYADGSDSPSWTSNGDGTWSRNIVDLAGNLAAIQGSSGTPQLQLENLHGDIVATADATAAASTTNTYSESTEFGVPRSGASATYGWLGTKRRSADTLGGLLLMGQRLYNPTTGRFLQTDPVPGGSANNYDYCNQDPVNHEDLAGTVGTPSISGFPPLWGQICGPCGWRKGGSNLHYVHDYKIKNHDRYAGSWVFLDHLGSSPDGFFEVTRQYQMSWWDASVYNGRYDHAKYWQIAFGHDPAYRIRTTTLFCSNVCWVSWQTVGSWKKGYPPEPGKTS